MRAITKATCKRLNRHKGNPCIKAIKNVLVREWLIEEGARGSVRYTGKELVGLFKSRTEEFYPFCVDTTDEKKLFLGLYSRYPGYVSTTFTHGLNEASFEGDVNELVRLIARDIESGKI